MRSHGADHHRGGRGGRDRHGRVSPTDAVAATSVGRRLGLPARLLTILEGEGLVNDASSLVLLASAVAATTGTVHLWKIGLDFVYSVLVALAVGLVVGYAIPDLADPKS